MNTTTPSVRIVQWPLHAPPGARFMNQAGGDVVLLFQEGREHEMLAYLESYVAHVRAVMRVDTYEEGTQGETEDESQKIAVSPPTLPAPPSPLPVMLPAPQVIGGVGHVSGAFPLPPPSRANQTSTGQIGTSSGALPQPAIRPPPPALAIGSVGPVAPAMTSPAQAHSGHVLSGHVKPKTRTHNPFVTNVPRHTGKIPDNGIKLTRAPNGETVAVSTGPVEILPQPEITPPPPPPTTEVTSTSDSHE
jgi:hypothetical protein